MANRIFSFYILYILAYTQFVCVRACESVSCIYERRRTKYYWCPIFFSHQHLSWTAWEVGWFLQSGTIVTCIVHLSTKSTEGVVWLLHPSFHSAFMGTITTTKNPRRCLIAKQKTTPNEVDNRPTSLTNIRIEYRNHRPARKQPSSLIAH